MGFKCGIVGLPNVGKSTLFNALTKAGIDAANFPFCTIEPNTGIVPVPDPRLDQLAHIVKPQRVIPTTMEFVDIAGLVQGAAQGEGLGNKFLANIREVDAIAHVVRCFDKEDVVHVSGRIDPLADIDIIHTELALADLESAEKQRQKIARNARSGDKQAVLSLALLDSVIAHVEQGLPVRSLALTEDQQALLASFHFLTAKPMMYVANVNEDEFQDNAYLQQVGQRAAEENSIVVALSNKMEEELIELDDEEKALFLQEMGLSEPGLNRMIRAGYQLLNLQTYFTAGVKEVRAWTIPIGASAPQAASVIHTDFERGFIRAEVTAFDDFIRYQGEQGAKEQGKLRVEGKEYIVADGDVMHFRFNV